MLLSQETGQRENLRPTRVLGSPSNDLRGNRRTQQD
jgi:hypothetical protein